MDLARIYVSGELIQEMDLASKDEFFTFVVESENGCNTIGVEKGRIRVVDADCPDGLCVRQGWISKGSSVIVCLPNRLVIQIESAKTPEVDAIAR